MSNYFAELAKDYSREGHPYQPESLTQNPCVLQKPSQILRYGPNV